MATYSSVYALIISWTAAQSACIYRSRAARTAALLQRCRVQAAGRRGQLRPAHDPRKRPGGGHVKTAAEGHPEQSGGLGLEGEPAGARVRASRSGGCNRATLWPAGAYDYMRRASAEGGHNAVNHSPKETLTISYEQWQTIGSVAEGRRQDVGGPPQGGPGVLQASKRAYRPPAETTVSEEQA